VGTVQDFKGSRARMEAVTREDVQRVARQYLVKDGRNVLLTSRKGGGRPPEGMRRPRERRQTEEEGQ